MDIWRAENLMGRTSPEWLNTMFDEFPVEALIVFAPSPEDYDVVLDAFSKRHPDLRVLEQFRGLGAAHVSVHTREAMLELLRDTALTSVVPASLELTPLVSSIPSAVNLPSYPTGKGTAIAIVDTGILTTSPIFGRVTQALDFVDGSTCASDADRAYHDNP